MNDRDKLVARLIITLLLFALISIVVVTFS